MTKPNQKGSECFMFKNYTINQKILPLDMEQYISETDVAFAVNALVEEKIKVDLYVFSKFTNVKVVGADLFVVNVRKQKVSETDKF